MSAGVVSIMSSTVIMLFLSKQVPFTW